MLLIKIFKNNIIVKYTLKILKIYEWIYQEIKKNYDHCNRFDYIGKAFLNDLNEN